jgi:hypothetical protein
MDSDTAICNLALSHLGISQEINNVETERSKEASACRRFLLPVKEEVFRDMKVPFSTKIDGLALITENPNSEWKYAYRYPSGCLFAVRILSGYRNDTRQTRVPYKVTKDSAGKVILTDKETAELEFVSYVDDVTMYPPDFGMAVSLLLASYIAPRVTGGDPFKMGDRALKFYNYSYAKAKDNAFNEQQEEELPESEFVKARD